MEKVTLGNRCRGCVLACVLGGIQKGSLSKMVRESKMTALLGEAALFVPGYERSSPVAPSDLDRLIEGYRLAQTALLEDA